MRGKLSEKMPQGKKKNNKKKIDRLSIRKQKPRVPPRTICAQLLYDVYIAMTFHTASSASPTKTK